MKYSLGVMLIAAVTITACGPSFSTIRRYQTAYANPADKEQNKGSLVVKIPPPSMKPLEVPSAFVGVKVKVDRTGKVEVDEKGNPLLVNEELVPWKYSKETSAYYRYWVWEVRLNNTTDHVIKLQGSVIRMFDPADNEVEALSRDDLQSEIPLVLDGQQFRMLPENQTKFKRLRMADQNLELLPGRETVAYLVFPNNGMVGTWKLALYDITTETDDAGKPKSKVRFEFNIDQKVYADTYKAEGFDQPVLISTEEIKL